MGFNKLLNTGFYWKFMCERLADEARLYVADDVFSTVSVDGGWRALCIGLWKRKISMLTVENLHQIYALEASELSRNGESRFFKICFDIFSNQTNEACVKLEAAIR
jgi:hypothetical protein